MCLMCSYELFQKYQLENHKNVHDPDKEFRCSYPRCSCTYESQGEYNHHYRSHFREYADFKCKDCNKTFTEKKTLDQHMVLHTEVLKEVCEKCGKRFCWRSSLRVHIWVKHPLQHPQYHPGHPVPNPNLSANCQNSKFIVYDQENFFGQFSKFKMYEQDVCDRGDVSP